MKALLCFLMFLLLGCSNWPKPDYWNGCKSTPATKVTERNHDCHGQGLELPEQRRDD